MIPRLLAAEVVSTTGRPLSKLVSERMAKCPSSGEINRQVEDASATLENWHEKYAADALSVDNTDGCSIEFAEWRFNIRRSNTEPVVRLDLENRGDVPLLEAKAAEVLAIVES